MSNGVVGRQRFAQVASGGILLIGLVACSPGETLSPATPAPESPDAAASLGGYETNPDPSVPVDVDLWEYMPLAKKPIDDTLFVSDGNFFISSNSMDEGRSFKVESIETGESVIEHSTTPGYYVDDVFLDYPWLVAQEIELELEEYDVQLFRYDLRTGKRIALGELDITQPTEPELAVYDGHVYYASGHSSDQKCMNDLDLEVLSVEELHCTPSGWLVGDPKPSRDGLVLSETHPEDDDRCKRLIVIKTGMMENSSVPAVEDCVQWSGNVIGDTVVWGEIDPRSGMLAMGAPLYARTASGSPIELGMATTESVVTCGDWFYWRTESPEIRRWKPGSHVEIVYRPSGGEVVLGRIQCHEELLTFLENTVWSAADPEGYETILSAPLDQR